MRRALWILGSLVALAVAGSLTWRWLARRVSLPCPAWLSGFLEVPYMQRIGSPQSILERLDLRPGLAVLDAGCGPGRIAIPAARRVAPDGQVVALDVQEEMIEQLKERVEREAVTNLQPVHGDLGEDILGRDRFDRALLVTVLGEIVDREAALRALYVAMKPGGILSITEMLPDPHYQRPAVVRELAQGAGFRFDRKWGGWAAYTMNFVKEPLTP